MELKGWIACAAVSLAVGTGFCAPAEADARKPGGEKIRAMLLILGRNMWSEWIPDDIDPKTLHPSARPAPAVRVTDEAFHKTTEYLAKKGVNMVVLDLGEMILYPSHPELAVKGSWAPEKVKTEVSRLRKLGLEPIPKLNFSTSHNGWLKQYRRMLSTPVYYKVCEDVLKDAYELFGHPRFIHIGMDEEDAKHQANIERVYYVSVRLGEFWWHDFLHLVRTVEKLGARAWTWSDYGKTHPEEFARRCPKSVVVSNWYYDEGDLGFDLSKIAADNPKRASLACYYNLRDAGFDQVPCASNWVGGGRKRHGKLAEDVIGRTVELARRDLDTGHLRGYLMTSWRNVCDEASVRANCHVADLFADALEGRIPPSGTWVRH